MRTDYFCAAQREGFCAWDFSQPLLSLPEHMWRSFCDDAPGQDDEWSEIFDARGTRSTL
jgi:hypothetical protein